MVRISWGAFYAILIGLLIAVPVFAALPLVLTRVIRRRLDGRARTVALAALWGTVLAVVGFNVALYTVGDRWFESELGRRARIQLEKERMGAPSPTPPQPFRRTPLPNEPGCLDFETRKESQEFYDDQPGFSALDLEMDADEDGIACESLDK